MKLLNKLVERAFQLFLQQKMKKWPESFQVSQMVPADDSEAVERVGMAAFTAEDD